MAITLKVTPSELESTASAFGSKNFDIQNTTREMMNLINGISGDVWSGEAATQYTCKFKGLQDDINTLCQRLTKETKNLEEIARNYRQTEQDNQNAAAALSDNVIS